MKEELTIRVAKPEDAKGLLEIYAPYVEKTAITFEYGVPSEKEFAGRIRHIWYWKKTGSCWGMCMQGHSMSGLLTTGR